MTPTNSYRNFRRKHPFGPVVVAGAALWLIVLLLAACGEVRATPKPGVRYFDDGPRPVATAQFVKVK